mgnify:FL=1
MADLKDRNIMLTGASGGIGRASALAFAEAGARVVLVDRDVSGLEEVHSAITSTGGKAYSIVCDITNEEAVAAAVEEVVARFGKLHGAFNNAGVEQSNLPLHEISSAAWERIVLSLIHI